MMNLQPFDDNVNDAQDAVNESGGKLVLYNLHEFLLFPFAGDWQMPIWVGLADLIPCEWLKSISITVQLASGKERVLVFANKTNFDQAQSWGKSEPGSRCYKLSLSCPEPADECLMVGIEVIDIVSIALSAGGFSRKYFPQNGRARFIAEPCGVPDDAPRLEDLLNHQRSINRAASAQILDSVADCVFVQPNTDPLEPIVYVKLLHDEPVNWLEGLDIALSISDEDEVEYTVRDDIKPIGYDLIQALVRLVQPADRGKIVQSDTNEVLKGWYRLRLRAKDKATAKLVSLAKHDSNIRNIIFGAKEKCKIFHAVERYFTAN